LIPSWASDITSAAQRTAGELAQERGPDGLGFRGADIHAEHLAPAVGVDPDRDDDGDRHDAAVLAHFDVGGIDPQVEPVAFDRAVEEGLHLLVDLFAQAAHVALGDAARPHRLDQVVDRARRAAVHVGLLHHGGERLLGHAARLQEAGEVAVLGTLGMRSSTVPARVSQSRSR
jgi:hypothetical protein